MSIQQGTVDSFKLEQLSATHDFTSDTFKLALYGSSASLGLSTTAYTSTGEVGDSGSYVAGGVLLTPASPVLSEHQALMTFSDLAISATLSNVYGALVYNTSKSNKAVLVLDFGGPKQSVNGVFRITFPPQTANSAVLQVR